MSNSHFTKNLYGVVFKKDMPRGGISKINLDLRIKICAKKFLEVVVALIGKKSIKTNVIRIVKGYNPPKQFQFSKQIAIRDNR